MKAPYIDGEWKVLFRPEKTGNYINDHSIFKAHDGNYHLFGITSFKGGATNERYFAHGVTSDLSTPMIEQMQAIDRGTLAWAPCVIRTEGEYYYLFITYTNGASENYHNTLVFASKNPKDFGIYNDENGGAVPIAKLFAHAPEIIKEGDEFFITTCGWNGYGIPNEGAVSVAPLKWKEI